MLLFIWVLPWSLRWHLRLCRKRPTSCGLLQRLDSF